MILLVVLKSHIKAKKKMLTAEKQQNIINLQRLKVNGQDKALE